MADLDLQTALNMFVQGSRDLGFQRSLNQANEAIRQVQSSEANDAEKRAQQRQISDALVTQMAGMGIPESTMAHVAGVLGPQKFANSNDMYKEGILSNNKGLQDKASELQQFENDPKFELAKLKALRDSDPLKKLQFAALQDERFAKHIEGLDKRVDTQTARFGNIAKLEGVNNTIKDARQLLSGDIYNMNVAEVAKTLDRILSQAAPTMSGTTEVTPHTIEQMRAKTKEWMTSKPQKVNIPEFVDFYNKTLDRIEKVNKGIIREGKKNVIESIGTSVGKMNPEGYAAYVKMKLQDESAEWDPKTGKISFKTPDTAGLTKVIKYKNGKPVELLQDANGKLYAPE